MKQDPKTADIRSLLKLISQILFSLLLVTLTACQTQKISILAINDVYRIEGVDADTNGGLARVRTIRQRLLRDDESLILLLAGDFLSPSLLSRHYQGRQMIDVLNLLDGQEGFDPRFIVTFGNHEFDKSAMKDAQNLADRIKDSDFTWLGSNIEFLPLIDNQPHLKSNVIIEANGLKVGIFSITTRTKHPAYVKAFLDYHETARTFSRRLREAGADIVIGLTHLSESEDIGILNALGGEGPDLIIGGHEHNRLSRWSDDGKRVVVKADAEARTATHLTVSVRGGRLKTEFEYLTLDALIPQDPVIQARAQTWLRKHEVAFCKLSGANSDCLSTPLATALSELVGEELEIRRFETNLGDWILDNAKSAFVDQGAQLALMNSGGLRLNQNIPAGAPITRRHIEELIAYPTTLQLIEIKGRVLKQMLNHAIEDWTGNGWFLQVSGIRFQHNSDRQIISNLRLDDGTVINDSTTLKVVVNDFLLNVPFGQDGYDMISPRDIISDKKVDLKTLIIETLSLQQEIHPVVDGRICNTSLRPENCL